MTEIEIFQRLGLALLVGLLIGVERGWQERATAEGGRVAGIRTFGLIGLGGGLVALLVGPGEGIALAIAFAALAALIIAAHYVAHRHSETVGITTAVAALVTFLLGAAAGLGYMTAAAASAVVVSALLSIKPALHRWLQRLEYPELTGALKLLLISVVVLPVLPDRGFGPYLALNPYRIWLMVVLIAAISFVGYAAIRLIGPARGLLLTGLVGGLTSSTAVTLTYARLSARAPETAVLLAAGAGFACAIMFVRTLLVVGLLNLPLAGHLAWPLVAAAAVAFVVSALLARRPGSAAAEAPMAIANPFELGPALRFGALLAFIMVLAKAMPAWLGDGGLYLLAALSGLGDVDGIAVSMAETGGAAVALNVAAVTIGIAAAANTIAKAGFALAIGAPAMAWRLAIALLAAVVAGGGSFLLQLHDGVGLVQ